MNINQTGFPVIHIKCPWASLEDMHVAYSVYQVEDFENDCEDIEITAQYVYYNAADVAAILSESQIYAVEVAIYKLLKGNKQ